MMSILIRRQKRELRVKPKYKKGEAKSLIWNKIFSIYDEIRQDWRTCSNEKAILAYTSSHNFFPILSTFHLMAEFSDWKTSQKGVSPFYLLSIGPSKYTYLHRESNKSLQQIKFRCNKEIRGSERKQNKAVIKIRVDV